jgi:hypothetical protein
VARGMCGLCTKISNRNSKRVFARLRLPKVIRLALGGYRTMMLKSETIYAITQPPEPPPKSTGVDGAGSASGVLEVMVKRSAKESIGMIMWCVV